jgi:hypothetical protein
LIPIAEFGADIPLRIVFGVDPLVLPADFGFDTEALVAATLCVGMTMSKAVAITNREDLFMGLLVTFD